MKKVIFKFLILCSLIILSRSANSQKTFYIGTKSYETTSSWSFNGLAADAESVSAITYNPPSNGDKELYVSVGKYNSSTGILILATQEDQISKSRIGTTIFVYLKNGKSLLLNNRIGTDHLDGTTISIYTISESKLAILKSSNIDKIRYSLNEGDNQRNLSASNICIYYHSDSEIVTTYDFQDINQTRPITKLQSKTKMDRIVYSTASEISALFSN